MLKNLIPTTSPSIATPSPQQVEVKINPPKSDSLSLEKQATQEVIELSLPDENREDDIKVKKVIKN